MTAHSLRLAIVPDPSRTSFSGSDYWLRMEQITGIDIAEPAEMAEIIDELYGIEACSPEPTPEEELPPITWERLMEIAKRRLDIEECRQRASGDYTARVRVIYSHPGDPDNRPKLSVTIGRIVSQQIVSEEISLTLSVREQTSITLDYPVLQKDDEEWPGSAKWLGSVFNEEAGPIPPPDITGRGNVLSWPATATGTILVKFTTTYELVTISVPGIPRLGSLRGDTQPTLLRAFWRLQVYELQVDAVNQDTTADGQTLAQLCGWDSLTDPGDGDSDDGGSDSDGDGDDDDDGGGDGPELGCLEEAGQLASAAYYREVCCHPPSFGLPDCAVYAGGKGATGMTPQEQERIRRANRGRVDFVAVGPGPDGCGRIITHQQVNRRNCCADIIPLSADPSNPTTISAGGSVLMRVNHGMPGDLLWQASGNLVFRNGLGSLVTTSREERVYAPAEVCQRYTIRVEDICDAVSMPLETSAEPLQLEQYNEIPDGVIGKTQVVVSGGVPVYSLTTSGNHTSFANGLKQIDIAAGGTVDVFVEKEQVCDGDFEITASDACGAVERVTIKIASVATGQVCVRHRLSSSFFDDPWLLDRDEPLWVNYTELSNTFFSYIGLDLPNPGLGNYVVCNTNNITDVIFVEITTIWRNNRTEYVIYRNFVTRGSIVEQFCDECK